MGLDDVNQNIAFQNYTPSEVGSGNIKRCAPISALCQALWRKFKKFPTSPYCVWVVSCEMKEANRWLHLTRRRNRKFQSGERSLATEFRFSKAMKCAVEINCHHFAQDNDHFKKEIRRRSFYELKRRDSLLRNETQHN